MLEVKLRNSSSIKLMNYCIGKYVQVILCLFAYSDVLHVLTSERHELLALRMCLGLPPVFGGVRVAYRFSFLFCVFLCLFCFVVVVCLFLSSSCVLCAQLYKEPNMTDKFEHIIVLNQIKFHPLRNVKHNILYTIEISLPCQAILNI